jgi:hypothetical protein
MGIMNSRDVPDKRSEIMTGAGEICMSPGVAGIPAYFGNCILNYRNFCRHETYGITRRMQQNPAKILINAASKKSGVRNNMYV